MAETNRDLNLIPTIVLILFAGLGAAGVGVLVSRPPSVPNTSTQSTVQPTPTNSQPSKRPDETSQKQGTFTFEPPPEPTIPVGADVCSAASLSFDDEGASSSDSNIFIALDPPNGQAVGATGQIRAWASDEAGGRIPASTTVDASGNVTKHSDSLIDKDSHGYPWEPAIYVTLLTSPNQTGPFAGDKENGGTPRFLTAVKGKATPAKSSGWLNIPTHDDPLPYRIGTRRGDGVHVAEFIWNVASLGLSPGAYRVQVAVHDGDSHLAVECTTILVQ
ncbi:hypothetical protein A3C98_02745 [Candidatus Roizmanbacteria bacterium RIFCSPHIGHO2_02_FULL_37_15]|uniref:Uncharacterized protein n=1 Tax=Candidatus Roizmanbacteria bacterium RIFCSPLOWO2_01_FULL_37_16 TaxID=1802058 RepID=A0A1F7IM36_9BACT|nr:MAG: hypothetical protein A2859_05700 [Candidatus Roizmanbacteria bacterium RIFCSPHIGHO2_01_FULL_37_16b]OGK22806.1 MAG: hypothetical protein A3C98_02745 [Candidatus Roizmanbacteria bacterium RIFCSPHIGHO2_02_FULL_37_15]OGK44418.1 MAG: hypothetical protein A3B40_02695 [Candidatus Roizmanbacteria bacterium RIFCSPLOWO2_01_FULL_37_16]